MITILVLTLFIAIPVGLLLAIAVVVFSALGGLTIKK